MIVVYGPTGVGKTAFVDELAQSLPAEIVNADMGQMYTPLNIGTAKPNWRDESVPHHLFDIVDEPKKYTVVSYRALVEKTMRELWQKNKIPILVGGSAFYLKSLFFPPISNETLEIVPDQKNLWEQLNAIDPERAQKIPKQDRYRLERAMALYKSTGKKPSEFKPLYDPPADYTLICLTRDRKELYERIDQRVTHMMDEGWMQEAQKLRGTQWESFILEKKIIGYDNIIQYLNDGTASYEDLIAIIQKRTRNYAKRQMTFLRMLKRQLEQAIAQTPDRSNRCHIKEVNLTSIDLHLYINQLQKDMKKMLI